MSVGIVNNRAGMIVSSRARVKLAPGKNLVRKQAAEQLLADPVIQKLVQAGVLAVVDVLAVDQEPKRGPGRPRKTVQAEE